MSTKQSADDFGPLLPSPGRHILSYPPIKQLASVVWPVFCITVLLPVSFLRYSLPTLRPDPNWTWIRSALIPWIKQLRKFGSRTLVKGSSTNHLVLRSPEEAVSDSANSSGPTRGVWIEPATPDLVTGQLHLWLQASGEGVSRVPGYWYGPDRWASIAPQSPEEVVLLAFHG